MILNEIQEIYFFNWLDSTSTDTLQDRFRKSDSNFKIGKYHFYTIRSLYKYSDYHNHGFAMETDNLCF